MCVVSRTALPWYAFLDDYGGSKGDDMGRMTSSSGAPSSAEAERAASIVAALGKNAGSEDVFAAFEELDALPPDVVRSVLTPWTGPAPDPQRLDAATRKAHGFPAPPLEVRTIRIAKPRRAEELSRVGQEQVRVAGSTWDGLDLPATARVADDGGESSFAGTLEHRVVSDVEGTPMFDVLLYGGDSGAIFRAGTTELVGAIAYGTVEMKDRRARIALQASLATTEIEAVTPAVAVPAPQRAAPKTEVLAAKPAAAAAAAAAAAPAAPSAAIARDEEVESGASTERVVKKAAAKTKTAAVKKTAAKKPAAAKAAAKKTAAKKPAAKETAVKQTAAKKTAAKKPAVKKPAVKKTAAKKPAAKKPAAKKTAAKKTAAKKTAAKKTAAKKTAAKKTAAKKTAVKKKAR